MSQRGATARWLMPTIGLAIVLAATVLCGLGHHLLAFRLARLDVLAVALTVPLGGVVSSAIALLGLRFLLVFVAPPVLAIATVSWGLRVWSAVRERGEEQAAGGDEP